jgi:hypothetical protein
MHFCIALMPFIVTFGCFVHPKMLNIKEFNDKYGGQEDLIVSLIQQDLKHNQLTTGLRNVGLEPDVHCLEIIEVVARLMGVEKDNVTDQWAETYFSFMDQAHQFKISDCNR